MWQANIFDFTAWSNKFTGVVRGNYSISSDSITITATSNDAYTQTSGYSYVDYRIPVTAGFKYRLTWSASNNNSGRIMVFANGQTSSNMMFEVDNANTKELIFTAPSGTTYITMRVGVNYTGDSITYSNIKFQEEATWYIDTSGELNNILRANNVFKESTTFSILSGTKKIMKDFDDARNNKTYAHANTIMEKNEAEFLCTYMVYYYNFICKIDFKKIKI